MLKSGAVERYAKALFDLGVEEQQLDRFSQEINEIEGLLTNHPDLGKLLYHPRISENDKKDLMRKILGKEVSPLLLNFIMLIIDKGREKLLQEIILTFKKLVRQAKGIVEVQVYSAFPLAQDQQVKLATTLKNKLGKEIEISVSVDPNLIGGLKIRIGDRIIDGSIQQHLERIKENLGQIQISQLGVS